MPDLYRAEWPILDRTGVTVAELKDEARRDLVTMLHDAGLVPLGQTVFRLHPGQGSLSAVVPVRQRAGL